MMPYMFHMGTAGVFIAEPVSKCNWWNTCLVVMLCTVLPEPKRMGEAKIRNVLAIKKRKDMPLNHKRVI